MAIIEINASQAKKHQLLQELKNQRNEQYEIP
jgi:hypothetical protein